MRKLLFAVLIALLPSLAFAFTPAWNLMIAPTAAVGTTYCAACPDTTNGGDTVCEVFDSSADGVCNWTATQVNCAILGNHTPDNNPALGCTNIQTSYVIDVDKTVTDAGNCYTYYDTGATKTNLYVQFYIKIISEGVSDTNVWAVHSFGQASNGTSPYYIAVAQVGADLKFRLAYYTTGWNTINGGTAISTDTWYGIRVQYTDTASDEIKWWVDYANNGTWTAETGTGAITLGRSARYAIIGDTGSKTELINFQIAGFKADDDTMPNACDR